jgi:hypothetical protein
VGRIREDSLAKTALLNSTLSLGVRIEVVCINLSKQRFTLFPMPLKLLYAIPAK